MDELFYKVVLIMISENKVPVCCLGTLSQLSREYNDLVKYRLTRYKKVREKYLPIVVEQYRRKLISLPFETGRQKTRICDLDRFSYNLFGLKPLDALDVEFCRPGEYAAFANICIIADHPVNFDIVIFLREIAIYHHQYTVAAYEKTSAGYFMNLCLPTIHNLIPVGDDCGFIPKNNLSIHFSPGIRIRDNVFDMQGFQPDFVMSFITKIIVHYRTFAAYGEYCMEFLGNIYNDIYRFPLCHKKNNNYNTNHNTNYNANHNTNHYVESNTRVIRAIHEEDLYTLFDNQEYSDDPEHSEYSEDQLYDPYKLNDSDFSE